MIVKHSVVDVTGCRVAGDGCWLKPFTPAALPLFERIENAVLRAERDEARDRLAEHSELFKILLVHWAITWAGIVGYIAWKAGVLSW